MRASTSWVLELEKKGKSIMQNKKERRESKEAGNLKWVYRIL